MTSPLVADAAPLVPTEAEIRDYARYLRDSDIERKRLRRSANRWALGAAYALSKTLALPACAILVQKAAAVCLAQAVYCQDPHNKLMHDEEGEIEAMRVFGDEETCESVEALAALMLAAAEQCYLEAEDRPYSLQDFVSDWRREKNKRRSRIAASSVRN